MHAVRSFTICTRGTQSTLFLENLIFVQLVTFLFFHGTLKCVPVVKSLSRDFTWRQVTELHSLTFFLRSILIFSSHIWLRLLRCLFPSVSLYKIVMMKSLLRQIPG